MLGCATERQSRTRGQATPSGPLSSLSDDGRGFRHDFRRLDGVAAAVITSTNGFLDLAERRLVADPAERLRALATGPAVLGLG